MRLLVSGIDEVHQDPWNPTEGLSRPGRESKFIFIVGLPSGSFRSGSLSG